MARNRVLLVDDDAAVRFGVRSYLSARGYEVQEAGSLREADEMIRVLQPDAALIDYLLPDGNALDFLPRVRQTETGIPVVIFTGNGTIDLAVRALREGAEHFLTKPVEMPALEVIIERALENHRNRQKEIAGRSRRVRHNLDPFLGTSAAIRALAEQSARVPASESPILIQGETGTGKGVLARWIQSNGPRAEEAFVDLNCAGLSKDFLETELFGHEKGAFTGAVQSKAGLLEVAHRGTVFLDEIGDLDPQVQPKVLKVLEEKRFRRLGEVRDRQVDIRLIAATHQDLSRLMREKKFRSDLFFRISTIPLFVPALRTRPEDIPYIARHLLENLCAEIGRSEAQLSNDAERAMQSYHWPGNIRELRNTLERALLFSEGNIIERKHLFFEMSSGADIPMDDLSLTLEEMERKYVESVLTAERYRVDEAARRLGIPRSSLYQKIKKYGIVLSRP